VKFEHATGYKRAPNVTTYDTKTFEGAYLAGIVAGGMSKSNTVGVVASVPIPEVVRNINSFVLGAQSVNPAIQAKVVWVNEWFSPPKEAEAATSLINGGVDVLYQNTNSPAVLKTAEERGVRAFGKDGDMSAYAPKAHLGSAVVNWAPYYTQVVQNLLEGRWDSGAHWWGVKEGAIDLEKIAAMCPPSCKSAWPRPVLGSKTVAWPSGRAPSGTMRARKCSPLAKWPTMPSSIASIFMCRAWKARCLANKLHGPRWGAPMPACACTHTTY